MDAPNLSKELTQDMISYAEEASYKISGWKIVSNSTYGMAYEGQFGYWTIVTTRAPVAAADKSVHCEAVASHKDLQGVLRFAPAMATIIFNRASSYFRTNE